MLFSSITFLFLFLPLVLLLYYLLPKVGKNVILLVASLIFYAWGEPVYVVLMILSILFHYLCGLELERLEPGSRARKRQLVFAIVVNLVLLGAFKYYGFFIGSLNSIFRLHLPVRELPLPIGISFYTFQAMSYIIDIYRGDAHAQKRLPDFALYITMFPQLIAGPIVRYTDIEAQLAHRELAASNLGKGAVRFVIGLGKKVILANGIGAVFDTLTAGGAGSMSVAGAWIGAVAYALQIYYDFSGYSDMAIGLGHMFGFTFNENFNYPYLSASITEFWRRWHISLSTWFREYVYIPLGGNRRGVPRQILNLLIVWTLTGFWHGAAWNFLAWGLYYGILLVLEKFVWGKFLDRAPAVVRHIYTLLLVLIGWVFFFSPSLGSAGAYLKNMIGIGAAGFIDKAALRALMYHLLLWIAALVGSTTIVRRTTEKLEKQSAGCKVVFVWYLLIFLFCICCLITDSYNPFLYFRF